MGEGIIGMIFTFEIQRRCILRQGLFSELNGIDVVKANYMFKNSSFLLLAYSDK